MFTKTSRAVNRLKDNRGVLSVDFLFAMTLAAVMCMMMFAFTTTLTMIEIVQYVAYSTARAHAVAHKDQKTQIALAKAKFESFSDSKLFPALSPLLANGWFEIDPKSLDIRGGGQGGSTFNDEYGNSHDNALPSEGVRFRFHAPILKMNLPFLGSITESDDFGTWVTAFLFREPTMEECKKTLQTNIRYQAIKKLDRLGRFQRAVSIRDSKGDTAYFPLEDNGC